MVVHWYRFLERFVRIPGRPNAQILARVATDQLVFTPLNMLFFFSTLSVLEGSDPKEKLRASYWTGLKTNWMFWPTVQLVNFKVVPLDHRLLVVNVISLGKPSLLCAVGHYENGSFFGNIRVVPQHRLTQFGWAGWNSYLSLLNQKTNEKPEVSGKVEEILD